MIRVRMSGPVDVGDTVAGKYLVERILGKGGMGIVVAAKHLSLGERVAIKFLSPQALDREDLVTRFLREASTAASIRSEYVARVYDVGKLEDGCPYIVMEYLEGSDLWTLIEERGPLDIKSAVKYALQACEALAEAHALGIVHRDLKPENLVVIRKRDGSSAVKLIDFGISKRMPSEEHGPSITGPSVAMGSPRYMAPEQMSSARDVDPRADVWALGAVLYHVLSGVPPFRGDSPVALLVAMNDGPRPLRQERPDVPEGLEAVILRCLRPDPKARFADMAHLAAALAPHGPPLAAMSADVAARILRGAQETGASPLLSLAVSGRGAAAPSASTGRDSADPPTRAEVAATLPAAPVVAPLRAEPAGEEVAAAVREALQRLGISGKVVMQGRDIAVYAGGPPTVIDAERIQEQWPVLPPEMRTNKAEDLASRLASAHRAVATGFAPPTPRRKVTPEDARLVGRIAMAGVAVAAVGAAVLGVRLLLRSSEPPPPQPAAETPEERQERLDTACRASRKRIYSGATIGPFDTAGWTIELWLARRAPPPTGSAVAAKANAQQTKTAPTRAAFSAAVIHRMISGGRVLPAIDEVLSQVDDGVITVEEETAPALPGWSAMIARFSDGYARAFFEPDKRERFAALADRLHEATGADLGALYARCAVVRVHDVGAWFRGEDAAGAATALVHRLGMFAEQPQVDEAALAKGSPPGALDALRAAAAKAKLDADALQAIVGQQGGSVSARPSSVTLLFGAGPPLRAMLASRAVAERAGVAIKP